MMGDWSVVGLIVVGVVAALAMLRGSKTHVDPPSDEPTEIPLEPVPIGDPQFLGFLFLKPWYGYGERIVLNTGPEHHGTAENCSAQTHGILDNGSGPYSVKLRAFVLETREEMPIYLLNGGPEVQNTWIDSGFVECYLLGARPYSASGILGNCNEFIPMGKKKAVPMGCGPSPTPSPEPCEVATTTVAIEVAIRNRFGIVGAAWRQTIQVASSSC